MNFDIYKYIAAELCTAIDKAYKNGVRSIAKKNKDVLQFAEVRASKENWSFSVNPLTDVSYTDVDRAMINNFKVEAFTVAGVMSYELEEKLKQLAIDIQSGKHPLTKGEKDIKKVWEAEAMNILSDYIPVEDLPPPSYLQTNIQTAINSSYHGSRWQRLQDPNIKNLYPAYQYKTRNDGRVRPEHVTLHDKIYQNDDPIWSRIVPPNGWNCRCYYTPLTTEEIQASNSPVEPITDDATAKRIVEQAGISKDFDRNPGERRSIWGKWLKSELTGKMYNEILNSMKTYNSTTNSVSGYKISEISIDPKLAEKENEIKSVLNNADETWGETYNRNGVVNSEINYIKYNPDHTFQLVRVNNGNVYSIQTLDFSKLDDAQKGVIML